MWKKWITHEVPGTTQVDFPACLPRRGWRSVGARPSSAETRNEPRSWVNYSRVIQREGRAVTLQEERERMRRAESRVLDVLHRDQRLTPGEVLRMAGGGEFDRAEIAAAIWRLAGVQRVQITNDLYVQRVS
jgi:hypothetical protein